MSTKYKIAVVLTGLFVFSPVVLAENCKAGKEYFEKGMAFGNKKNWSDAQQWLKKSVAECNQFDNWYLLGKTEQMLENYNSAASSFEEARKYAINNDQVALAVASYAEVLSYQGKLSESLSLIHQARKLHSSPPAWMEELAKKLDNERMTRPLTVSQVTRGLKNRAISLLGGNARSSVNIAINFKYDSVEVTEESIENISVLAQALADDEVAMDKVSLVGHTDLQGDSSYNLSLSKKRAQHIAELLSEKNPKLKSRLNVEGAGESEPLYEGSGEDVNRLNRRIEIFLVSDQ